MGDMSGGKTLSPYLSRAGAWSLALGTSVGWGSLVVTSNTYLAQAGPIGSLIGMLAAMLIMLVIAKNYHYMMTCFPESGGVYTYAKETFGYDHGFLAAWFLMLAYMSVCWANATSLPLFAKYFIGDIFKFGFHYRVFGYELYLGEALLSSFAILLFAFFCTRSRKAVEYFMIAMAVIMTVGIAVCFIGAFVNRDASYSMEPSFVPDSGALSQALRIATISPWAYIGFENISHSTAEFKFSATKSFRVLAVSIISATALYLMIIFMSVTCYPPEYATWLDYIRDIGNLSGLKALPAFYVTQHYLGSWGVHLLMAVLFALIVTGIVGNLVAVSRLVYAMAKDKVVPERYGELNKRCVPARAVMLLAAVSLVIPFLGRTAIGWIVDVTTLTATLVYGYVSASAFKMARNRNDRNELITGVIGLAVMALFGVFLLLPNLFSSGNMADESYFLFTVWAVLGFLFFRRILKKDTSKRFGKSIIVWLALLSLILFTSLIWLNQTSMSATSRAIAEVREYYSEEGSEYTVAERDFINKVTAELRRSNIINMGVVVLMFGAALAMLINNYRLMSRRAKESEAELGQMRSTAYRDPLTGVKSKHAYAEKEDEINNQIRLGLIDSFAVVVCDVNGLKHINDTYGHKAGDAYICASCRLICEIFKHSPVFRIGGDEFAVIMTGGDFEIREALMELLNKNVEENIPLEKEVLSAGISDYIKGEDEDLHTVFERADALMYARKQELKAMGAKTRE